ncbi:glycosyltransferase family 2 protein [Oenococcus oeni]|nr:glycosyltransferase family 2 protein [Oenococcus oeni]
MPNYNTGDYVYESVLSVLDQTYKNIELIIVDDKSSDNSINILRGIASKDNRVKLVFLKNNGGAANARNVAIKKSNGQYISFIDSDDLWSPRKLEKQIDYMNENNYTFVATYYDYIDFEGESLDRIIKGRLRRNYWQLLKDCPGNSTVIYNANKLGKNYVPLIRRRNDYLMWLQVIKKAHYLNIFPEILVHYRIRPDSLSRKKRELVQYHWKIYREYEHLNYFVSIYLTSYYIFRGVFRKIFNRT